MTRHHRFRKFIVLFLIGQLVTLGCNRRSYYRQEADREVDLLLEQSASVNPTYRYDNFSIQMDPRSRYFYDQDQDRPPMPMDDPDSNTFMQVVDGKMGWPRWERNGITNQFENPFWRDQMLEYVNQTTDGNILLDIDTVLLLAQLHSPTYQNQKETLYQSALDVSAERFRLDTQFFGGTDVSHSHLGKFTPGVYNPFTNPPNLRPELNRLNIDNSLQLSRQFATAGTLLVGLANSFVFTFSGERTDAGLSLINFSFVQPLLRNGGRVIALETLTIVERALFNNLRAFQRYRRGFFTNIAIGTNGTSGPQRRGGFLGGTGLTGFTGTGAGGIGGVGAGTFGFGGGFGGGGAGGGAAGTGLSGGGAGNVGGFIGLLQSLQQYRNARDSLDLQIRTLALLEGNLEGGVVDVVEVDQFRQTIETQRAQLLQSQNGLQRQIEGYLTGTLGLPPDLGVELDDRFIRRFQLIDPVMTRFQNEIYRIQTRIGELEATPSRDELVEIIGEVKRIRSELMEHFPNIRNGVEAVDQAIEIRKGFLDQKGLADLQKNAEIWKSQLDPILKGLELNLQPLDDIQNKLTDENTAESTNALVVWMRKFLAQTQEIVLLQARSRLQNVYIDDPVRLETDCALKIAYSNRLDYMNARSGLVDTWRLIEFNANSLQSDLTISARGDLGTRGNNILKFQNQTGTTEFGVQFDAPLTRLLERNNYRGALLEYQGARRAFVQATDGINSNLRNLLRSLNELELNLEIQRRAVDIAIRRVEVTEEKLQEPPNPDDPNRFGPTDVQNLSSALADLRNSQNNLMSVWLNYHANRMLLIRDLGIMQLDENGRWVDIPIDPELCLVDDNCLCEVPPDVPKEWLEQAFEGEEIPTVEEYQKSKAKSFDYFGNKIGGQHEKEYLKKTEKAPLRQSVTSASGISPAQTRTKSSLFQRELSSSPKDKKPNYLAFGRRIPSEKKADQSEDAKNPMSQTNNSETEKAQERNAANPENLRWAHRLKPPGDQQR